MSETLSMAVEKLVLNLEAENDILRSALEGLRATVSRSLDPVVWHAADHALRKASRSNENAREARMEVFGHAREVQGDE